MIKEKQRLNKKCKAVMKTLYEKYCAMPKALKDYEYFGQIDQSIMCVGEKRLSPGDCGFLDDKMVKGYHWHSHPFINGWTKAYREEHVNWLSILDIIPRGAKQCKVTYLLTIDGFYQFIFPKNFNMKKAIKKRKQIFEYLEKKDRVKLRKLRGKYVNRQLGIVRKKII